MTLMNVKIAGGGVVSISGEKNRIKKRIVSLILVICMLLLSGLTSLSPVFADITDVDKTTATNVNYKQTEIPANIKSWDNESLQYLKATNGISQNQAVEWIKARANESWWSDADGAYAQYRTRYPQDAVYIHPDFSSQPHECDFDGEFVFYDSSHPHYNCYKCSICGEIHKNCSVNETNYISTCNECNRPPQPQLCNMHREYLDSDNITFMWNIVEYATHYNILIFKKDENGDYALYDRTDSANNGISKALPIGDYYAEVQAYNSDFWEDGNWDWIHNNSDRCYFNVSTSSSKKSIEYNGNIYEIYDNSLTWEEAKELCESIGGHLVTITSEEEYKTIIQLIGSGSKTAYWLGASDEKSEGSWEWVTNEEFEYSAWGSEEPNNSSEIEHYLGVYYDSLEWNDCANDNTDYSWGFICEYESSVFEPINLTENNNKIYQLFDNSMTWTAANTFCKYKGGHLATITSAEENEIIKTLIDSFGGSNAYWFGATDKESEGVWKWVTGEEFAYTNWRSGTNEPNNYNGAEHYLDGYTYINDDFMWNDLSNIANKDSSIGFICEFEPYTITYNANGGTDAPESQTKVYGSALTLSSSVPIREGYTFLGWASDAEAADAQYLQGGSFTEDKDTTLYAVWEENVYVYADGVLADINAAISDFAAGDVSTLTIPSGVDISAKNVTMPTSGEIIVNTGAVYDISKITGAIGAIISDANDGVVYGWRAPSSSFVVRNPSLSIAAADCGYGAAQSSINTTSAIQGNIVGKKITKIGVIFIPKAALATGAGGLGDISGDGDRTNADLTAFYLTNQYAACGSMAISVGASGTSFYSATLLTVNPDTTIVCGWYVCYQVGDAANESVYFPSNASASNIKPSDFK